MTDFYAGEQDTARTTAWVAVWTVLTLLAQIVLWVFA